MGQFYVHEIRPNGETSTVGLYYFQEEAEGIVKQLQALPEKTDCRYMIITIPPPSQEQDAGNTPQ